MPYPEGFYVYQLCDPVTLVPFYVGKGQGNRAWQHEPEVRRGAAHSNAQKIAKIKEIIASGRSVHIEIVATYVKEADALDHEWRLVDADATLTNILPGGIGVSMSPARIRKLQEERSRMLKWKRQEAMKAAIERDRQREIEREQAARSRLCNVAKSEKDIQEIEQWAASLPKGVASSLRIMSAQAQRAKARKDREDAAKKRKEAKEAGEIGTYAGRYYERKRGLYGKYR